MSDQLKPLLLFFLAFGLFIGCLVYTSSKTPVLYRRPKSRSAGRCQAHLPTTPTGPVLVVTQDKCDVCRRFKA